MAYCRGLGLGLGVGLGVGSPGVGLGVGSPGDGLGIEGTVGKEDVEVRGRRRCLRAGHKRSVSDGPVDVPPAGLCLGLGHGDERHVSVPTAR